MHDQPLALEPSLIDLKAIAATVLRLPSEFSSDGRKQLGQLLGLQRHVHAQRQLRHGRLRHAVLHVLAARPAVDFAARRRISRVRAAAGEAQPHAA